MTAFSILDRRTRRQDPFFLFRWACWSLHCGLQRCWWSQEGRITVEDPDPSHVFQPSSQWCPDCLHHSDQPGFAETMVKALCHSPAVSLPTTDPSELLYTWLIGTCSVTQLPYVEGEEGERSVHFVSTFEQISWLFPVRENIGLD